MSRTDKDMPYRLGGQKHKYATSEKWHSWFTRNCRRKSRAKAKSDMRRLREPAPVYPVEREYYD